MYQKNPQIRDDSSQNDSRSDRRNALWWSEKEEKKVRKNHWGRPHISHPSTGPLLTNVQCLQVHSPGLDMATSALPPAPDMPLTWLPEDCFPALVEAVEEPVYKQQDQTDRKTEHPKITRTRRDTVKMVRLWNTVKMIRIRDPVKMIRIRDTVKMVRLWNTVKMIRIRDTVKMIRIRDTVKMIRLWNTVKMIRIRDTGKMIRLWDAKTKTKKCNKFEV